MFIAVVSLASCKTKDEIAPEAGTICIINAIEDAGAIKVNPSSKYIPWSNLTTTVAYLARGFYYPPVGNSNIVAVSNLDTNTVFFNAKHVVKSKIYTMYLSGTKANVDTMFREEDDYPFIFTDAKIPLLADSVVNVRFVNLSTSCPAVKIKLATGTGNEVDNLPYKGIGAWKAYPAKLPTTTYSYQIRDAATDALIITFNFSATATNRFKNVALVIRGVFGTNSGTAAFGISAINYF